MMAAVVDGDIDTWQRGQRRSPECRVTLVADQHAHPVGGVSLDARLDVDAGDLAFRSEVLAPQVKTTAAINADFEQVCAAADKLCAVALVKVEVVPPFPDTAAVSTRIEQALEPPGRRNRRLRAGVLPVARVLCGTVRMLRNCRQVPVLDRPGVLERYRQRASHWPPSRHASDCHSVDG